MTRRTMLSLVAIVCGLAAVVGTGLKLTADEGTTVGGNVLVQTSPDKDIISFNTPTILRNPTDADNVVLTYRVNYDYFSAFLEWSDDGGDTFTRTDLPLPSGTEACAASDAGRPCPFAADIAFADDGTLYALYVNLEGNGNVPHNLWLSRSTDGGRTLEAPARIAGELTFQPRIAVAGDGTIHLTWLQAGEVGTLAIVGPAPIVTTHSTDGGQTFSDPIVISDTGRERVGAATPVVDDDGTVTVLYQDFKADRRDFQNLEGPVYEEPFALVITRSTDGGDTWSPGLELEAGVIPTHRFLVFLPEFPGIATGPGDTLYATWEGGRNGDRDVFLKRSDDGGDTWSPAVQVNDDHGAGGGDQYLPAMEVNDSGEIFVLYYDRSADPDDNLADVVLATSGDQGDSWDYVTVSSAPADARIGPPPVDPKLGIDFGSRLGLDVWGNTAYTAWADTRRSDVNFGGQDIGVATVTLGSAPPPIANSGVVIVLFVVGALALVALWRLPAAEPAGRGDDDAETLAASGDTTPPARSAPRPAGNGRRRSRNRATSREEPS